MIEWNRMNKWAENFWSTEDPVPVNSYESEDAYLVQIPVAGVSGDALEVDLKDGILKIKVDQAEKDRESYKVLHRESEKHQFVQKLRIPKNADGNGIEAHVEDGVLLISIPKKPEAETKKIQVL